MNLETISDLKLTLGTAANQYANVLGYHAPGDKGGGDFYWDDTSIEDENGGTIFEVTGTATGRWKRNYSDAVNVCWFGAKGDGVVDNTIVIQKAIEYCATNGASLFIAEGTYTISSSLNVSNKNVRIFGSGVNKSILIGNFDDYVINGGGYVGAYATMFVLENLSIINNHLGSSPSSSGCLNIKYTQTIIVKECVINTKTTGVLLDETISTLFDNVLMYGDSLTNTNRNHSVGYSGQGRNTRIVNGRIYGFHVGVNIGGDCWVLDQVNIEWSDICLKTAALSSMLVTGCHIETSGIVWTNAVNLPSTNVSPWIDNGDQGIGWLGSATFKNTLVSFLDLSHPNGVRAPMFVIKSQANFIGTIDIEGCVFNVPDSLATVSNKFDYTESKIVVSGVKLKVNGSTGWIEPDSIPNDAYSTYSKMNTGNGSYFQRVSLDYISSDVDFENCKITNVSEFQLQDSTQSIRSTMNGTEITGYTTVKLSSALWPDRYVQFYPESFVAGHSAMSLGTAANLWSEVFAATGVINTSDDREKIYLDITEKEKLVAKELKSLMKKFKFNNAIEKKGEGARIHFGTSAQAVKEVFEKKGLDPFAYGLLCYNEWADDYEEFEVKSDQGVVKEKRLVKEAGNSYGIRYEELLCFIISVL